MITFLLLALSLANPPQDSPGELSLPWVFSDHMVLQREVPIPVWGTAAAGSEVSVSFGGATVAASADKSGHWRVDLPPHPASSDGRALLIATQGEEVRLEDVVVGEVWLCAGQSNMDFALQRANGGKQAAASASRLELRLCDRQGTPGGGRRRLTESDLARIASGEFYSGSWAVASAESAASFSAVGFFFGRELDRELDVPIGLIDVSVGGSTTEGWVPLERLRADPELAPLAADFLGTQLSHPFIRERTAFQLGDWVDAGRKEARPPHPFEPGYLYDSAIRSLAPFGVRGILWYQGESNAHLPRVADRLFRILVEEWRTAWGRSELPFYFVQLPGMGRPTWPQFRHMQAGWLGMPNVGMAVAIDVGHPTDVHPRDKAPVGMRLARLALADTYGRDVAQRGPQFLSARRKGTRLELSFENVEVLAWADGRGPSGFEVAGDDRRFYPASAEIHEDKILVRSPEVDRPQDVRYAWAPFPEWSLIGADGLPAAPFRSQDWEPLRIACVGDSITEGYGLAEPSTESYPARLGARLGDGFEVKNFGHSGTCVVLSTMRGDWARAFRRNAEHEEALLFAPDVVICNLGINDIMAWGTSSDAFIDDYLALIGDYRALSTSPRVLLWGPLAPLFPGQTFHGSPHEKQIHKAIGQVARRARLATIDLQAPLREHPEWFPDHIHPDARGASAIADEVARALSRNRIAVPAPRQLRIYVLTGQSNSLGTTADAGESDTSPGTHPADEEVRFFWSNRSTRAGDGPAVLIGDSGGRVTGLQVQQGEGQNPTFWGPEIGFARALHVSGERNFVIVKASRGGGGNGFWEKGSSDDHMYRHVVETVEAAVLALPAGADVQVAALLYIQGESDNESEAASAGKRLGALIKNLRRDLPNAKQMQVLVAGIAADGKRRDLVRERQARIAERDPTVTYFSNLDLRDRLYDNLHFDRSAKLEIGRRFAAAWFSLSHSR